MASKVKGGEKVVDVLIKSGADPDTAKEVIALQYVIIHPYLLWTSYFNPRCKTHFRNANL